MNDIQKDQDLQALTFKHGLYASKTLYLVLSNTQVSDSAKAL